MGFRFRRSIKIAPGIRWNVGKKSTSLTIGPRGAKMTIGTKGRRITTGIPGSGLSYTQYSPSKRMRAFPRSATPPDAPSGSQRRTIYKVRYLAACFSVLLASVVLSKVPGADISALICGFASFVLLIIFLVGSPEPTSPVRERGAAVAEPIQQRPLRIPGIGQLGRLDSFEQDLIIATRSGDAEALRTALDFTRHDLTEDESRGADEVLRDHARGLVQLLGALPAGEVPPMAGTDDEGPYWLRLNCMLDRPGEKNDETGHLTIRPAYLVFLGRLRSEWMWQNIVHVSSESETLFVQLKGRKTPLTFDVSREFGGARRACLIIGWKLKTARVETLETAEGQPST
jgi:hypothetical protein